ncbi:hypothetical protein M407DRAFT_64029 [Tulasnella calospora MUT 4182]|uniref:Major facilitator superfamily (MFS) profile domain-containing protein n=1 Tax=Tulasnella calospora MUT 4182 TaxID=1051891 RepID=A0A0C3MLD9_9AGAM|nr:hypothetical protein M407DRAFT_64029 [Tulasnella calospora MUT 4182]
MDSKVTPSSTKIIEAVALSRLDTADPGSPDERPNERGSSFVNKSQVSASDPPPLSVFPSPKGDSAVVEEEDVVVATQANDRNTLVGHDKSPIAYPPTAVSTPLAYERSNPLSAPPKVAGLTPGTTPGTLTPTVSRASQPPIEEEPRAERHTIRLASSFLSFFSCGWADGTPGTIIPHLEVAYGLSHFKVSIIFIAAAIGFSIGTFINEPSLIYTGQFPLDSTRRIFIPPPFQGVAHKHLKRSDDASTSSGHSVALGRFWTVMFGCLCQVLYYVIAISNPPFGALCFAFGLGGIAVSLFAGQMNAYVASASVKRNQGRELGYLHGFYGIGAFASPLICQSVLAAGWSWHRFYWTSFGFSLLNALLMVTAFHPTKKEWETAREAGLSVHEPEKLAGPQGVEGQRTGDIEMQAHKANTGSRGGRTKPKSTMQLALRMPYVWLFMAFLGLYTGGETTIGGWIVTYLLKQRNANPDTVGYVASGFWGGVASGRIILGHASPYLGIRREKHLVHVYIVAALVMTFIIWFVPSFIGNAFCAAMTGLFLGPIFPTSLSLATHILPKEVHLTALAAMGSVASIGTAVLPFAAGALASAKGVTSIQPFMCGILGSIGVLWFFFPSRVGTSK